MAYTNVQFKRFVQTALTSSSNTTVYTVPVNTQDVLKSIDFVANSTAAGTYTLTVYIVPSGGSPGPSNAIFDQAFVPASATSYGGNVHWNGTQVMNAGDSIIVSTNAPPPSFGMTASGLEIQ